MWGADFDHDAPRGDFAKNAGILGNMGAVPDAGDPETVGRLDRGAGRPRFGSVASETEARRARDAKGRCDHAEIGIEDFVTRKVEADNAAPGKARGSPRNGFVGLAIMEPQGADDSTCADPGDLSALRRAFAHGGDDFIQIPAATNVACWAEAQFDVVLPVIGGILDSLAGDPRQAFTISEERICRGDFRKIAGEIGRRCKLQGRLPSAHWLRQAQPCAKFAGCGGANPAFEMGVQVQEHRARRFT